MMARAGGGGKGEENRTGCALASVVALQKMMDADAENLGVQARLVA
jgi:hypothetical protein